MKNVHLWVAAIALTVCGIAFTVAYFTHIAEVFGLSAFAGLTAFLAMRHTLVNKQ